MKISSFLLLLDVKQYRLVNFIIRLLLLFSVGCILGLDSTVHAALKQLDIPILIDAYVESGFPGTITYGQRNLYLGFTSIFGKQKTRIYIKPNLGVLDSNGIAPDQIQRAKLFLYLYQTGATADQRVSIYKVGEDWVPTALTWDNQPPVVYYYYAWVTPAIGFKEFTLTNAFKQQYQYYLDTNENRGFMLRMGDENQGYYVFWSNECTLPLTPPFCVDYMRPYVRIEYRDNSVPGAPAQQAPQVSALLNQRNIRFEWEPTTDPDGDALEYRVVVARDPDFNDLYKQTTWSPNTFANVTIGRDGQYYWQVEVQDPYGNKNKSGVRSLFIDTHAPAIPVFNGVAPFLKVQNFILSWFIAPYETEVKYELQWSRDDSFSSFNTTGWISDSSFKLVNLHEGKYYARVRSKDNAGNISEWSRVVNFTVDLSKPKVLEFEVTPRQHNKRLNKKIKIKIQAQDTTLERIGIMIYSSGGGAIFEQFKQSDTMLYYWDVKNYPDDNYYIYAIVEDKLGNRVISEPISVVVDSVAPEIYVDGVSPNADVLTNKPFSINATCSEQAEMIVDIGNNLRRYDVARYIPQELKFDWIDSKKRIKLYCVDILGNKSSYFDFVLHIDKVAPNPPLLDIEINSRKVAIRASCRKGEQVVFGVGNKTLGTKQCSNRSVSYTVSDRLQEGTTYVFWARRIDKAGNQGRKSYKEFRYQHKVQVKQANVARAKCNVDIVTDKDGISIKDVHCSRFSHKVVKVVENMNNNISYLDIYQAIPRYAQVHFRFHSCTMLGLIGKFFGKQCTPRYIGQLKGTFPLHFRASISGSNSVVVPVEIKKGVMRFRVPVMSADIKLNTYAYIFEPLLVSEFGRKIAMNIRLIDWQNSFRVVTQDFLSIIKPFRWIFDDYKNLRVSQWFGRTRFSRFHHGIDIATMPRTIIAPAEGRIISVGYHKKDNCFAGGYYIGILHNNGLYTYYFHLSNLKIDGKKRVRGQSVILGEPLAKTGRSGKYRCKTLGYHLHFEVRTCGTSRCSVNPINYVQADWGRLGYTKIK